MSDSDGDSSEQRKQKISVWGSRFRTLRDEDGLNDDQLVAVYHMIEDARGFRFQHIADSAWRQLQEVLKDGNQ